MSQASLAGQSRPRRPPAEPECSWRLSPPHKYRAAISRLEVSVNAHSSPPRHAASSPATCTRCRSVLRLVAYKGGLRPRQIEHRGNAFSPQDHVSAESLHEDRSCRARARRLAQARARTCATPSPLRVSSGALAVHERQTRTRSPRRAARRGRRRQRRSSAGGGRRGRRRWRTRRAARALDARDDDAVGDAGGGDAEGDLVAGGEQEAARRPCCNVGDGAHERAAAHLGPATSAQSWSTRARVLARAGRAVEDAQGARRPRRHATRGRPARRAACTERGGRRRARRRVASGGEVAVRRDGVGVHLGRRLGLAAIKVVLN